MGGRRGADDRRGLDDPVSAFGPECAERPEHVADAGLTFDRGPLCGQCRDVPIDRAHADAGFACERAGRDGMMAAAQIEPVEQAAGAGQGGFFSVMMGGRCMLASDDVLFLGCRHGKR